MTKSKIDEPSTPFKKFNAVAGITRCKDVLPVSASFSSMMVSWGLVAVVGYSLRSGICKTGAVWLSLALSTVLTGGLIKLAEGQNIDYVDCSM